jgi:hypothetical protein
MNEDDVDHDDVKILCGDSVSLPNDNEKRFGLRVGTGHGYSAISVFVAEIGG